MRTVVVTCAVLALASGCGKDPKTLLAPGKPDLPPPLGGLSFGMAKADALAGAAPAGRMIGDTLYAKGYRKTQIELVFAYGTDRFDKVDISFPEGTNAGDFATAAWGAPVLGKDGDKEVRSGSTRRRGSAPPSARRHTTRVCSSTRIRRSKRFWARRARRSPSRPSSRSSARRARSWPRPTSSTRIGSAFPRTAAAR